MVLIDSLFILGKSGCAALSRICRRLAPHGMLLCFGENLLFPCCAQFFL